MRSRQPELAMRYYLLNVTRCHRPRAVVLADMSGQVVAGVEGRPFNETGFVATRASERTARALANVALADFRAGEGRRWTARLMERLRGLGKRPANLGPVPEGARVARTFNAGDRELLMVVVGEESGATLTAAVSGVQRILAEWGPIETGDDRLPSAEIEALVPAAPIADRRAVNIEGELTAVVH
ncbi:MAG: hypothetical protein KC620_02015 [Myxococcales bacterium]|nr:hypothetical protein [Myxococcales bacterium]